MRKECGCDEDDDGFIDVYEFKHCYCHGPDHEHDEEDDHHDEDDEGDNHNGGDNGGGGEPTGCEGTAETLYDHFN